MSPTDKPALLTEPVREAFELALLERVERLEAGPGLEEGPEGETYKALRAAQLALDVLGEVCTLDAEAARLERELEASQEEAERLEDRALQADELERDVRELEELLEASEASVGALLEDLRDVPRGVRTLEEVIDRLHPMAA